MASKDKIIQLRAKGWTYQQIGDRFRISRQRVHQILTGYRPENYRKYRKEYRKRYYSSPEGKLARAKCYKELAARRKYLVLKHYGNGKVACVKCGFSNIDALSIDHIEGGGTAHKKHLGSLGNTFYIWLIRNNYPKGFQTLCMNCQWLKRAKNNETCFSILRNTS